MMTLLITQAGTPLLVLSTPMNWVDPEAASFVGVLSLGRDRGTISVTCPPDLFGSGNFGAHGFRPDFLAHLAPLPGVWCVAVDTIGRPLAEWPACLGGHPPESVAATIAAPYRPEIGARAVSPGSVYRAILENEQVFAVGAPFSWPPGKEDFTQNLAPPALHASYRAMSSFTPPQSMPGGTAFGSLPALSPLPPERRAYLDGRLAQAIARLRKVVINGQADGENLALVLDYGISVSWAEGDDPARLATAPPAGGWDAASRTLLLPSILPEALDPCWLAAGLYAAYVSMTGQAFASRIAAAMLNPMPQVPGMDALIHEAASEAARCWIMLAEVSRGLAVVDGGNEAVDALAAYPWGRQALDIAPPDVGGHNPGYESALMAVHIPQAAAFLYQMLAPAVTAYCTTAIGVHALWHAPERHRTMPLPQYRLGHDGPAMPGPPPFKAGEFMYFLNQDNPEIICEVPGPCKVSSPLWVAYTSAGFGDVMVDVDDGKARVIQHDIPADQLRALVARHYVDVIFNVADRFFKSERVEVVSVNGSGYSLVTCA